MVCSGKKIICTNFLRRNFPSKNKRLLILYFCHRMAWFRREDEIYWNAKKIVASLSIQFMPVYTLGPFSEVSDGKRAQSCTYS